MHPPQQGERPRGHRWSGGRDFPFLREGHTSSPLMIYKQYLQEEMSHIPTLEPKVRKLIELQQRRMQIQKERAGLAENRQAPAGDSLKRFHALLKEEDEVNSQQKQALDEMAREADPIRKEIAARRQDVKAKFDALEAERPPQDTKPEDGRDRPDDPKERERRSLGRTLRFYGFLDDRMDDLKKGKNRDYLVNRFFKGMPMGDSAQDGRMSEQLRQRIVDIERQQDRLTHQMDELNKELELVRGLLKHNERQNDGKDGHRDGPWRRDKPTSATQPFKKAD
jgi:hypothetical protein